MRLAEFALMVDDHTMTLVQDSFAQVEPITDAAAVLFYERLFELDPSVKPLFKSDMIVQGRLLMQTIGAAVAGLDDLPALTPIVQDLGVRHARYGVQPEHYDTVGKALLWTLGHGLGDGFTPEVESAWTEVYALLAQVMQDAAASQGEN